MLISASSAKEAAEEADINIALNVNDQLLFQILLVIFKDMRQVRFVFTEKVASTRQRWRGCRYNILVAEEKAAETTVFLMGQVKRCAASSFLTRGGTFLDGFSSKILGKSIVLPALAATETRSNFSEILGCK